jgi:hypothetical protein
VRVAALRHQPPRGGYVSEGVSVEDYDACETVREDAGGAQSGHTRSDHDGPFADM